MLSGGGAGSKGRRLPPGRSRSGPSPRVIRGALSVLGVVLVFAFIYVLLTLYRKQAALAAVEAPPLGQWGVSKDETVAIPAPAQGGLRAGFEGVVITRVPKRKRHIVLSTGEGRWNTGVWPNWGQATSEVSLNWAAAGVVVRKGCPSECTITHDQAGTVGADAVVMEIVNHPKFGIPPNVPLPFPPKRPNPKLLLPGPAATAIPKALPVTVLFYFEATRSYPAYTLANPAIAPQFDVTMTPSQASTLPITLVCPWGRPVATFVDSVDTVVARKLPDHLFGYFNEHGVAAAYSGVVNELFAAAGDRLHAFQHRRNRDVPTEFNPQPFQLTHRIDFMGTYKFLLVTEVRMAGWVGGWVGGADV